MRVSPVICRPVHNDFIGLVKAIDGNRDRNVFFCSSYSLVAKSMFKTGTAQASLTPESASLE